MFIGIGVLLLAVIAYGFIWGKLYDIEQKQFRMHDEISLSLKNIEEQLDFLNSKLQSLENQNHTNDH